MRRLPPFFRLEERQYAPFIAAAIFFGLIVGFPLGTLLAHAKAQSSTLGDRLPALTQVHGHLQILGWVGLFIMGMGYRLVSRFTAVRVRPGWLPPLTFGLMTSGLMLRAAAQPFADGNVAATFFVISAVLEVAAAFAFAYAILRCLLQGRREEFVYSPFFGAGAIWLAVAAALNLAFVIEAAGDSVPVVQASRSNALTFVQLYGFAAMFIFAVSMRTFPIFFGRRPADRRAALAAWALANVGIAVYASSLLWRSYDHSAEIRLPMTLGFLAVGVALIVLVATLRIFEGTPHRLRESARRSMRFVRSAYVWLLAGAGLQVFVSLRGLLDERSPSLFEIDAARHFLALGFLTGMIIGMALLVLPPLAMRRLGERGPRIALTALLVLVHGAVAARGAGSLLANEAQFADGYWTMSTGGLLGILAMTIFAVYVLWPVRPPDIPLAVRSE